MTVTESTLASQDEQRLLAELQLCQETLDTLSNRSWQSTGIILAGAMATLALMLQVQADELETAVITSLFAIGATLVLAVWSAFVQREWRLQKRLIIRMREIEDQLGFRRQAELRGVEAQESKDLGVFAALANKYLLSVDQGSVLSATVRVVAAGWVVVVLWRWALWLT